MFFLITLFFLAIASSVLLQSLLLNPNLYPYLTMVNAEKISLLTLPTNHVFPYPLFSSGLDNPLRKKFQEFNLLHFQKICTLCSTFNHIKFLSFYRWCKKKPLGKNSFWLLQSYNLLI